MIATELGGRVSGRHIQHVSCHRVCRCMNCASVLQLVESEMTRADHLKSEGVQEKERHDAEIKQLWQTLKVASSDAEEMRDGGGLGGLFSTQQPTIKKG